MFRLGLVSAVAILASSTAVVSAAPADPVDPDDPVVPIEQVYGSLPAPQRLVDTRAGEKTADGEFAGVGKRRANTTMRFAVAGRVGLDDDPGSVLLNLTVTEPTDLGFLTVWPCDQERPTASNLNYVPDQTVAVAAVSRVAPDGTVCVYTLAATHLIVDAAGAFPTGSFDPLASPERLTDTREGERTVDGRFAGEGLRGAETTYEIVIAGRGSTSPTATAVALNVTATTIGAPGFLSVYPCDATRPNASNVNYEPGLTTPNLVLSRLDPDGKVCIYTLQPVDLIVDVAGSLPDTTFVPLPEPRRLLDTRRSEATFDGAFRGGGVQQDGATLQLPVGGRADVPTGATAVVLNVTSTGSTTPGFVTAHPQGAVLPAASNVNFVGGRTVANLVVAGLGPTGDVCLFTRGATQLVVDVAGWLTGPAPTAVDAGPSCPGRSAPETAETYRTTIVRRPAVHRVVGRDRVATYVCVIPANSTSFDGSQQHDRTDADVAAFANAEVTSYFDGVSGGAYDVEFVAAGMFTVGRDDDSDDCIRKAIDRTDTSFTNVLVTDSTLTGGGFASPGTIFPSDRGSDFSVLDRPASVSRRGGWVGGAVVSQRPNVGTIVHEIGHTLHWPHSYVGPLDEYDNPIDVMSSGFGLCRVGNLRYRCDPGNTLAFNRLAAGWFRNGQVISHPTGTTNYVLDRANGPGLQLIAAPDPTQPLSMLTIEARPAVGNDDFLESDGVAIHVVDQLNRFGGLSGLSTARIQRQAQGSGDSFDHVLDVGETATVHGLTISILRRDGDRYEVRVAGSYDPPGDSFFTESVVSGSVSCASWDAERAIAAGCVL